ncbi:sure-like protein [Obba rivulosa]|uniref:Sure-like protein n=1 Tax=Obba rivulosa TaxID=1052685 RepID=A0A8E2DHR8_9APHY|nr:sure-like protein [Obba rivulosa]
MPHLGLLAILALALTCSAFPFSPIPLEPHKIVLTNDDGWAVAQIRAQNDALKEAGFDVILSSPAENESGTGSATSPPTVLNITCEFDTCPVGAPPEGFNKSDSRLNYVNSFPVDAVRYGIKTLAPRFFRSPPDFIVSGPNVGNNLGNSVFNSGTVGAACEAAREGLPSTAFSGDTAAQVSYTTLESASNSTDTLAARAYASLTASFTRALLASPLRPVIPHGTTLNVNFPSTAACPEAKDFSFVFTRLMPSTSAADVRACGSDNLPDETTVVQGAGCFVSVTVLNATSKMDVDAETQRPVFERLRGFLTCLPSS